MDEAAPAGPVAALIAARCGISLSAAQRGRVEQALRERLAGRTQEAYVAHLSSPRGALELAELLAVVSVHKTELFRDAQQLQGLARVVLPRLLAERPALSVWSAGCATGEEVATLLVLLAEAQAGPGTTVLGTDIAQSALEVAGELTFPSLSRVPPALRRHFESAPGGARLRAPLREQARFARHNLMDSPYPLAPHSEGFDLIVCRNVLIYFTHLNFERVVDALAERLRPGGVLLLSTAEPILKARAALATESVAETFFSVKRTAQAQASERLRLAKLPEHSSGEYSVAALAKLFQAGPPKPAAPAPARPPAPPQPIDEGLALFARALEGGPSASEAATEVLLRQALYLVSELSPARYLLGVLLEQRGQRAEAASEFRRALQALDGGKSISPPFFLKPSRLRQACLQALQRLGP